MAAMKPLAAGTVIGGWTVGKVLGNGEFGYVQEASRSDVPGEQQRRWASHVPGALRVPLMLACPLLLARLRPCAGEWVIKVCPRYGRGADKLAKSKNGKSAVMLWKEYGLYATTFTSPPCPRLMALPPRHKQGDTDDVRWLVLPRLGRTLKQNLESCPGGVAPWPTIARAAVQLLEALEYIHGKSTLFVDLNPGNVMFGRAGTPEEKTGLYLVDFGLAAVWKIMGEWRPACLDGAPGYTPVSAALGMASSPRDDLEGLMFLLAQMIGGRGALPWLDAKSQEECEALKVGASGGRPGDEWWWWWWP